MEYNEELYDEELYKGCDDIHFMDCEEVVIYGVRNKLDEELFKSLTDSEIIKVNPKIYKIKTKMDTPFLFVDILSVGHISSYSYFPKCSKCNLQIPVDMMFYSNKTAEELNIENLNDKELNLSDYNLCKLCYNGEALNEVKIISGLDNIYDWIHIFDIEQNGHYNCFDYSSRHIYKIYCNLNKNSCYYGRFANHYCVDMSGEQFSIMEERTIEDVLKNFKII